MKDLTPMKHLLMVAATPIQTLEAGLAKLNRRRIKAGEDPLRAQMLAVGRAAPGTHHTLWVSEVVIFLRSNAYRANQDLVNPNAIGIIIDDPMTLACIRGPSVSPLDWEMKGNGMGMLLHERTPLEVAKALHRVVRKPHIPGSVTVSQFDYIPTILNAVSQTVSFVNDLAALNYSLREEVLRVRLRAAFLDWVRGPGGTPELVAAVCKATGVRENNNRLQVLVKFFNEHPKVKRAMQTLSMQIDSKKPISYDKLSATCNISTYDLRYVGRLFQKNPPHVMLENSERVHVARRKGRFAQVLTDDTNSDTEE